MRIFRVLDVGDSLEVLWVEGEELRFVYVTLEGFIVVSEWGWKGKGFGGRFLGDAV